MRDQGENKSGEYSRADESENPKERRTQWFDYFFVSESLAVVNVLLSPHKCFH